jgi:hypothetical protein
MNQSISSISVEFSEITSEKNYASNKFYNESIDYQKKLKQD